MRKLYYCLVAALLFFAASCQQEEIVSVKPSAEAFEVYASIEGIDDEETRTYLSGNEVYWSSGDKIAVFYKNTLRKRFDVTPESIDSKNATFLLDEGYVQMGSNVNISHNVAYYPFCEVTCAPDGSSYTLSNLTLPSTQSYVEGSVGLGAFPMVAVTENTDDVNFCFKNICGVMQFQLKGSGFVKSVSVKGNRGEVLAGPAVVTAGYGNDPYIAMSSEGTKEVTLDCGEGGVELNETTPVSFFIVLPPVQFEGGFTITVTDTWGGSKEYSTSKKNPVGRSKGLRMPAKEYIGERPTESVVDMSLSGTANSYIVSQKGAYKFKAVKGNSSESVGAVSSAEVLWETFGTDVTPNVGDLVKAVSYKDGEVIFQTADTFKEGNAVVAAKDASGNILWSWHIWLTDEPQGQEYYNNAGTMMDRNLGATSATPGDVGALGLLYQWGRKDPFLGSSSISDDIVAKSTITWPSGVSSDSNNGTIEYAIANPTTFITSNSGNYDWYYTGSLSTDNTCWTTSSSSKSIYDPCPAGWRVPDGGNNGVWSMALGSLQASLFDDTNEGINFSGKLGADAAIWYPASGCRSYRYGSLSDVGSYAFCWSASPNSNYAYYMYFIYDGRIYSSKHNVRAYGLSVRCVKEGTTPSEPVAVNLSQSGTANSYIVSSSGSYKFSTVKGNSSESVGAVSSAEVLWETFGTDVTPNVGDLVKNVSYKDGEVTFQTADTFKEGNAVIASKNASGKILWSWHIWLTDQPAKQVYYNGAGAMMDRNLGATSATPGDVGALGLLYQWGRKEPFLGSSSISTSTLAKSTITWPSGVSSDSNNGTIEYAIANPTTFITSNSRNYDWYYTGDSSTDNTRWEESINAKSIYDPCPAGWRVPDSGDNGVWPKALGSSFSFTDRSLYNSTNKGMNFSGKFGSDQTIWYPASGSRSNMAGGLDYVGNSGYCWSASPRGDDSDSARSLYFNGNGSVLPLSSAYRAYGLSVRCVQE